MTYHQIIVTVYILEEIDYITSRPLHSKDDVLEETYTPRCAPGALGIWSEVICRGGPGYRTGILQPALRPRSNIGLPNLCSMPGAQRSSMEAPVGNYLTTQNSQISEPTQGSPERVLISMIYNMSYFTSIWAQKTEMGGCL